MVEKLISLGADVSVVDEVNVNGVFEGQVLGNFCEEIYTLPKEC